jgi:hypothetical protein
VANGRRLNVVYRAVNKPLTTLGADRRHFYASLTFALATWVTFDSIVSALFLLIALLIVARKITEYDTQLPRILVNSSRFRHQYDPAKRTITYVEILRA